MCSGSWLERAGAAGGRRPDLVPDPAGFVVLVRGPLLGLSFGDFFESLVTPYPCDN